MWQPGYSLPKFKHDMISVRDVVYFINPTDQKYIFPESISSHLAFVFAKKNGRQPEYPLDCICSNIDFIKVLQ